MSQLNFIIIVNPASGKRKGLAILDQIRPQFTAHGIEVEIITTLYSGHAKEIVQELDLSNYQALCIIGGDGTYHEVINGMLSRNDGLELPLGLIPAGTGNSLLQSLNLIDLDKAVDTMLKGHKGHCDLAKITTEKQTIYSFNVIGWGLSNNVNILAEKLRWFKGQRYHVAAIIEILRNRSHSAIVYIGNEILDDPISFITACNTPISGNGMQLAPKAKIDDGLLDVLLVRKTTRFKLLKLFLKILSGTHLPHPSIAYHQVSEFKLDCTYTTPITVDGETLGSAPFSVKMLPNRITIFR